MHPVITQAIAAERAREFRAAPARLLRRLPRRGPGSAPVTAWALRGPRSA